MGTEGLKKAAESVSSGARGFEFRDFKSVPEAAQGRGWRIKLQPLERPIEVYKIFAENGLRDVIRIRFEDGKAVIEPIDDCAFLSFPPAIQAFIQSHFYSITAAPPAETPSGSGERRVNPTATTEVSAVTSAARSKIEELMHQIESLAIDETLEIAIPPANKESLRGNALNTIRAIMVALQERMCLTLEIDGTMARVTYKGPVEELDIAPDPEPEGN